MVAGPNNNKAAGAFYATERTSRRLNVSALRPTGATTRPARTVGASTSSGGGTRQRKPPDVAAITKDPRGKNPGSIKIILGPRPVRYPMPKNPGASATPAEKRRYFALLIRHHRALAQDLGWLVNYWLVKAQHLAFWQRQHAATVRKLKARAGVAGLGDFEQQRATIATLVARQADYREKIAKHKKRAAAARAANQRLVKQIRQLQRKIQQK